MCYREAVVLPSVQEGPEIRFYGEVQPRKKNVGRHVTSPHYNIVTIHQPLPGNGFVS